MVINMKKIIAIASCLLILSGCVSRADELPDTPSSTPETSSSEEVSAENIPTPPLPEDYTSSASSEVIDIPTMTVDFSRIDSLPKEQIPWGPGVRMDAEGRSEACVMLQAQYGQHDTYFIMPNEPKIYLTFDQGYENGYTEEILDILKAKDVKAVFFITGHYAKTAPDLINRMIDEGHIIGNHSMEHLNFATAPLEETYDDVAMLHNYVKENFDYDMTLFRYPEGAFNEQSLAMLDQMGYTTCFWSFAYADWNTNDQLPEQEALDKLVAGLQPGSIPLLHSVGETNTLVLDDFIDMARALGYSFELLNV